MAIDTGKGGFDINGKNYTYGKVEPGENANTETPVDNGDFIEVEVTDIGEDVKETIGRYLSDLSSVNAYPLDRNSTQISITDNKGLPVNPSPSSNSNTFTDHQNSYGEINQEYLNGNNKIYTDPAVELDFVKGRTDDPNKVTGNTLLQDVQQNQLPDNISRYTSAMISNNRFSAAAENYENNILLEGVIQDNDDVRRVSLNPRSNYNPTLSHPKYGDVSLNRLANVGPILSLRSSGELGATDEEVDPTSFGSQVKALLPSISQTGASRIDLELLRAKDILESLTGEEIGDNELISIAEGGSWGSLNNIYDRFSGINANGMIALSAALTSGVFLIYEGLEFILSLINVGPKTLGKVSDGSYMLGRSTIVPRTDPNSFPPSFPIDISNLLGIRQTVNPFKRAVDAGTAAFFGVSNSGSDLLGQLGQVAVNSTRSPGFNVVVARSIIRSGVEIIDSFKDVNGNVLSIAEGILGILETIRNSKIIGALNVFAALGDQLLLDENTDTQVNEFGEAIRKSKTEAEPDEGFARNVVKNRIGRSLKLAWASNRSPAAYIVPDSTAGLSLLNGIGSFSTGIGLQVDTAKVFYKQLTNASIKRNGARIPYDGDDDITVKKVEQQLEAEYVPFYMHDLRTNEIISFHAFITSLTDDYTPNWDTTNGFGRVDPIKVYKDTGRKVTVGFYIAATSEEDFKDMWVKINKLTTMVYPQYTKGRSLITPDNSSNIIQPFSQLIGASPLIRLRLGDLIRSNYSRFNLSRLFGADTEEMKINNVDIKFEGLLDQFKIKMQQAIKNKNQDYTWAIQNDNLPISTEGITLPSISISSPLGAGQNNGNSFAPTFQVDQQDLQFFVFRVIGENDNTYIVKPEIASSTEIRKRFDLATDSIENIRKNLEVKYDNSETNSSRKVVGGSYVINKTLLMPTASTIDRIKNQVQSGLGGSFAGENNEEDTAAVALARFLQPDKNAVVRAFQETKGKGLAGTIDGLNFDFYTSAPWETNINQRGPKLIRVNLTFTPIHDISPGLDHQGYNRAPIYPLGHHAFGKDDE